MAYVDYEFYSGQYLGVAIPAAEFPQYEREAAVYLDAVTHGNTVGMGDSRQLKMAVCAVADACRANREGGGIANQKLGQWSVDYVRGVSKAKTESQRLYEAAKLYLAGTGMLCRCAYAD